MIENISTNRYYPKISIVTPAYNSVKFINDAIKSVLSQNYENFEHIIIDGGSTDGTIGIIKKYPHLKWISETDEGQSDALNKAFKLVSGEIIGWLNSDDIYLPNSFEKVISILEDNKVDGVYSNLYFGDEKLNVTRKIKTHNPVKWLSLFHCFIPSATFFFKRKIINKGIMIDKSKQITMDKDFFARILYSGYNLKYVNDYFSVFRWHSDNKSIDSKKVKEIRYNEGLQLFNLLSKYKLPYNRLGLSIYIIANNLLLVYRKILKLSILL